MSIAKNNTVISHNDVIIKNKNSIELLCNKNKHNIYSKFSIICNNNKEKTYSIYFPVGILKCTIDQKILCPYNKTLSIGDAMKKNERIYTISGFMTPTAIENTKQKTAVFDICGHVNNVYVSSILCLF